MADFTVALTGTAQIGDSIVAEELKSEFIIAYNQTNVIDAVVEYDRQIDAKSISFPRFSQLADATTPLNEREDVDSVAMADSDIILTPAEYGNVVTTTRLAELQTSGRAGRAAVALVGQNMASTMNALGTAALEASTNVKYGGDATGLADLAAADIMTPTLLNTVYNKMARANVPVHPSTGTYIAFMHDDVIHDLRNTADAGSWLDSNKYDNSMELMKNEVGMYKGFRIIRNNASALLADGAGTGSPQTLDSYTSTFLGYNGLGKAESQMPGLAITGPFDKLARFVNVGWYGVLQYKIIETDAVWKTITSSSIGDNA